MVNDLRSQVLIRDFVELCRDLGLRVVAEGVETSEQGDQLAARGGEVAPAGFSGGWCRPGSCP